MLKMTATKNKNKIGEIRIKNPLYDLLVDVTYL